MGRAKVWRRPVTRMTSTPWACARRRVARSVSEMRNSGLSRVPSISMAMRRRELAVTVNFSIRLLRLERSARVELVPIPNSESVSFRLALRQVVGTEVVVAADGVDGSVDYCRLRG